MIIEFIGTPGAGKSTLLPTVIEYLQQKNKTALTVVDAARPYARRTIPGKLTHLLTPANLQRPLLWQVFYHLSTLYRLRFFIKNSRLIWYVLNTQYHRPIDANHRRRIFHGFFHTLGYYEFLKSRMRPEEILVFDEGFAHRVVQMNSSDSEKPNPARISGYINLIPQPDLLVFVHAPRDICEKRIYSRGLWKQFHSKSPEQVSKFVTNAYTIVNMAVDHIKTKKWPLIEINNENSDLILSKTQLLNQLQSSQSF